MQYNSEIGKIYDSIFFFREYYSDCSLTRECADECDVEFMSYCYSQIREKIEPPEILRPLFFPGSVRTNAISEFFADRINFLHDTIDDFIVKLLSNIDVIYQITVNKIFNISDNDNNRILPSVAPAKYLEALNNLKMDDSFKLQVSLLLGNFNYAMSLFADLLKKVYTYVDALHGKYQKEIEKEFKKMQSEANLKLYEETLPYSIENADSTVVSIALLNQYLILGPNFEENMTTILAGLKHDEMLKEKYEICTTSLTQFLIACGNELRIRILETICENGELTLSQIAKILDASPATVIRHMEVLVDAQILQISRREGLQIFYKINAKLFRYMKINVDEFFVRMQKDAVERRDEQ